VNILSETDYTEQRRREAELLVPVGDMEGVGAKLRDRLIDADIASVQRLAQSTPEVLMKIEGIGQKTADTLIERAKEFVARLEEERRVREAAEKKEAVKEPQKEEKLAESDVFADEADYVTGADDIPSIEAPDLEDVEEAEDDKESK
jgi:Holliday junction resolvasome RuvABC DNA-binding subunit